MLSAKYSVTLPAGAKVTIDVKAEKGSDLYPGIDRIVDPAGNDILDPDYLNVQDSGLGGWGVLLAPRQEKTRHTRPRYRSIGEKCGLGCSCRSRQQPKTHEDC